MKETPFVVPERDLFPFFEIFRACLNFIDGIYYEAILERNKENFAGIVGHYGEKFNAVAAQNSHNKAIE